MVGNLLDRVDRQVVRVLQRYGDRVLRFALAGVFIAFGALKPLGLSPAEPLMLALHARLFAWSGLPEPAYLWCVGLLEVAVGVCLAFRPLLRLGIALLVFQMAGACLPVVVLPGWTWTDTGRWWVPTMEGQYILKNVVIVAAAMVVAGNARRTPEAEELG